MESVLGRYRNLIILVGVLFLQVLGLAVQVKRGSDTENTRLIRIWAVSAITPFERGMLWLQNGASNIWHNYLYLRGVRAENRDLKEEIEQMRLRDVRLSEDAAQAQRLQSLLAFKEQYISKTVAAQVIGSSGSDLSRAVYIDKGSDDDIQTDMAVITATGIVGKVLHVYPSTALVLLINDQTSGVGAILEKSRLQGVLVGTPSGEIMLKGVMSDEQAPVGETILTSGGDQIFPKGLPVGTISKVGAPKDLFLNITVKPSANLSKLEEVLVVLQKQERQAVAQEGQRTRAADILAQRLPSVPDQPPANPQTGSPAGTKPPATTATSPAASPSPAHSTVQQSANTNTSPSSQRTGQSVSSENVKNATQPSTPARTSPTVGKPASGTNAATIEMKPATPPTAPGQPKTIPDPPPSQTTPDPDVPH